MKNLACLSHVLFVSLALVGCGGDGPTESPSTSGDDDNSAGDDASVTVGLTLGSAGSESSGGSGGGSSGGSSSAEGTSTSPETTDPTVADSGTSAAEGSSSGGSDGGSTSTTGDLGNTIYEVQDGTLAEGADVEINGVIVTGIASNGIYAEEPGGGEYSGVFVFATGGPDLSGAQVGDVVNFTGVTAEYMGNTEVDLTNGTFEIVSNGTPLDAETIDAMLLGDDTTAEPWEGVLVRVEGDLSVTMVAGSNEFVVNDGTNDIRVDDFLYEAPTSGDFAGFDVGASFTAIAGPLNYFNSQFKLAARGAEDFEGYAAP